MQEKNTTHTSGPKDAAGERDMHERSKAAGRTALLIAAAITFVTGIFGGYLLAREKPTPEKVLSDDVYLVGIGDSPTAGPDTALVTIAEFNDMLCRKCTQVDHYLRQAVDLYPGQVRVVWKHLPDGDDAGRSMQSARFGVAAENGGKFWAMHDKLASMEGDLDLEEVEVFANDIGLDGERIRKEVESGVYDRRVDIDIDTAERLGIEEAPTVFVNGKILLGEISLEKVKKAVEIQLPEAKAVLAGGMNPVQVYWEIVKTGKNKIE